ncbi:radical SAM family heme chaperone HemW [Nitratifractor sp.]
MLLYLHIPFCDSKCHYCAFHSYTDRIDRRGAYMEAVRRQLLWDLERFGVDEGEIETVFVGGGTPSTVEAERYGAFFETLSPFLAPDAEITVEANPNSATPEWLRGMRALGANRLSLGVQSFDDGKLRYLGRAHDGQTALHALEAAREAGFGRISLDLIYNCAPDTPELLERDIALALQSGVEHLSAYELTIESGTAFASRPEAAKPDEKSARLVSETIRRGELEPYEVSNFGTPCRHNLGYWEGKEYLGIGAGAVGFVGKQRYYPVAAIEHYLADPTRRRIEALDAEALRTERIFLGLRSIVGVDPNALSSKQRERARILVDEGKLIKRDGRLYNDDFFLADELALFILS